MRKGYGNAITPIIIIIHGSLTGIGEFNATATTALTSAAVPLGKAAIMVRK
jgi:hypothetical protein